jgi:pimeloyl-ACP methyl ester carboxylesterase
VSSQVPIEESDVETSFGTTHVLTAGDPSKPPLVAVHALALSSTMWIPVLPTLTASHHVWMLDAVGDLNKSVASRVLSSPAQVVDWMDEVVDALGIERAAFVAESLGTWMATHYAMARPPRVERLALLGPAGIVSAQHVKWLATMIFKFQLRRSTPATAEREFDTFVMAKTRPRLRTGPWRHVAQQFITGMPGFHISLRRVRPVRCDIGRLAAGDIPVLVVVAREETLHDGATMANRFRQQLPHARVVLVDDANHIVLIDETDIVERELQQFLAT